MLQVMSAALVLITGVSPPAPGSDPCAGRGTVLLVQARQRVMSTCERGRRTGAYRVALGSGGVGKRAEGDKKLPVGRYALGSPRPSRGWHLFIPIGYPTPAQRKAGYTGASVGIHGPPRCCHGPSLTDFDWTYGCIALGTDTELDEIAAWITRRRGVTILVEDEWERREDGVWRSTAHGTRTAR